MAYYSVAAVTDRRINDDDGSIEYAVQWVDSSDGATWERRHHLTENCAEMVQVVDQQCMDGTDTELAQWRRSHWDEHPHERPGSSPLRCGVGGGGHKRSRSSSRADSPVRSAAAAVPKQEEDDTEVLHGLLLRAQHQSPLKGEGEDVHAGMEEGTVLMLGEVVLAEEASACLNNGRGPRKKRQQTTARAALALHTSAAMEVEKEWHAAHGHSLLHSLEVSHAVTPFRGNFESRHRDEETRQLLAEEQARSSQLRILSIAPPRATHSGAVFGAPVALDGLVGEKDLEEMRLSVQMESPLYGGTAQEITKPHVEQMVVRYIVSEFPTRTTGSSASQLTDARPCGECIASMPLSVFRLAFPQLLIDYLLDNSVVLH